MMYFLNMVSFYLLKCKCYICVCSWERFTFSIKRTYQNWAGVSVLLLLFSPGLHHHQGDLPAFSCGTFVPPRSRSVPPCFLSLAQLMMNIVRTPTCCEQIYFTEELIHFICHNYDWCTLWCVFHYRDTC